MILKIDDKGVIFSAKMNKTTIYNPNTEIEKDLRLHFMELFY